MIAGDVWKAGASGSRLVADDRATRERRPGGFKDRERGAGHAGGGLADGQDVHRRAGGERPLRQRAGDRGGGVGRPQAGVVEIEQEFAHSLVWGRQARRPRSLS